MITACISGCDIPASGFVKVGEYKRGLCKIHFQQLLTSDGKNISKAIAELKDYKYLYIPAGPVCYKSDCDFYDIAGYDRIKTTGPYKYYGYVCASHAQELESN